MIKCTTTMGENERSLIMELSLRQFEKTNKKRRIFRTVLSFCFAVGFLFFGLCGYLTEGLKSPVAVCIFVGLVFLVWGIIADKVYKARAKRRLLIATKEHLRKNGTEFNHAEKREYTFSEDGVEMKNEFQESHYNWNLFSSFEEIKQYILLTRTDNGFFIIDKNTMESEEINALYKLLEHKGLVNKGEIQEGKMQ